MLKNSFTFKDIQAEWNYMVSGICAKIIWLGGREIGLQKKPNGGSLCQSIFLNYGMKVEIVLKNLY